LIPVIVILVYLCVIGYIGSAAFKRSKANTEDFFLAGRSVGAVVFFLSLFATNMTSVAILGSSGAAYKQGIGVYGLMASSSGLIIPLTILLIGTRLWALGKRFGHMTQVQLFRDRWECSGIGTFIFALTAAMLLPYLIVSMAGGGHVLATISSVNGAPPLIPFWLGCLIVAVVVTANVFFGGMRGVVWVNVFQTILFVTFGTIALVTISANLPGGLGGVLGKLAGTPGGALLARDRMPPETFFSYMFIPFSSIMFPHMAIMCLSARKLSAFKNTVIAYPIAIMFTWLPCVFLGVVAAAVIPGLVGTDTDTVLLRLLSQYAPVWLAGILGAGIISAVMGSDCHQVLALSTMFTKDIFSYYGGKEKFGEKGAVFFARVFVVVASAIAYVIALNSPTNIFELAVRFAFSGFAAMAPVMIAALFWKRSTKWGALASSIWVAVCVFMIGYLTNISDAIAPKPSAARPAVARGVGGRGRAGAPGARLAGGPAVAPSSEIPGIRPAGGSRGPRAGGPGGRGPAGRPGPRAVPIFPSLGNVFMRDIANVTVFGYLPVVPMILGSALLMIIVSLVTPPPSRETIARYFPAKGEEAVVPVREPAPAELV
jgi:SSS family solute:Na+ symporter